MKLSKHFLVLISFIAVFFFACKEKPTANESRSIRLDAAIEIPYAGVIDCGSENLVLVDCSAILESASVRRVSEALAYKATLSEYAILRDSP